MFHKLELWWAEKIQKWFIIEFFRWSNFVSCTTNVAIPSIFNSFSGNSTYVESFVLRINIRVRRKKTKLWEFSKLFKIEFQIWSSSKTTRCISFIKFQLANFWILKAYSTNSLWLLFIAFYPRKAERAKDCISPWVSSMFKSTCCFFVLWSLSKMFSFSKQFSINFRSKLFLAPGTEICHRGQKVFVVMHFFCTNYCLRVFHQDINQRIFAEFFSQTNCFLTQSNNTPKGVRSATTDTYSRLSMSFF